MLHKKHEIASPRNHDILFKIFQNPTKLNTLLFIHNKSYDEHKVGFMKLSYEIVPIKKNMHGLLNYKNRCASLIYWNKKIIITSCYVLRIVISLNYYSYMDMMHRHTHNQTYKQACIIIIINVNIYLWTGGHIDIHPNKQTWTPKSAIFKSSISGCEPWVFLIIEIFPS